MPDQKRPTRSEALDERTSLVTVLVTQAQEEDRFAFDKLIDLFHADIFRMVYYRTGSQMDAEDVTQDIFMQAYRRLGDLRTPDRFKSWLYSIAVNRVRDFHRKKRFRNLFGGSTQDDDTLEDPAVLDREDPEALKHLARKDFWKGVEALLGTMSRMEREIFTLRFMSHLSIREIAETLKKNESTVKTHLYRAVKKFKQDVSMQELLREELP